MPDLVRLRNITSDDLGVGQLGGQVVGADCVVDIPARLLTHQAACRDDECQRCLVWPDAVWQVETPAKARKRTES